METQAIYFKAGIRPTVDVNFTEDIWLKQYDVDTPIPPVTFDSRAIPGIFARFETLGKYAHESGLVIMTRALDVPLDEPGITDGEMVVMTEQGPDIALAAVLITGFTI